MKPPAFALRSAACAVMAVSAAGRAAAQTCNCSCDLNVPQCTDVTAVQLNESGQNPGSYVTAGIGTTDVLVRHANRFTGPQLITHVCIALRNPSTGSGSGDAASVFIAGDAGGLPGGFVHTTPFIVTPNAGPAFNHQIVALSAPVQMMGTYWVGVSYPTARHNIGHQGVRPRTAGAAAVYIDTLAVPWINYDNTGSPAYVGNAPVIRPLTLVPSVGGVLVNPTSGLVTTEPGGTAQFDVVLANRPPTSDVWINLLSTDPTEGLPTVSQLTFTIFNWNIPQTVTVVGQDDPILDGDIPYQVQLSVVSGDPCYNGVVAPAVSLTNRDDEVSCGAGWSLRAASGPTARYYHALGEDGPTRRPLLYGGADAGNALGDTRRWTGSSWMAVLSVSPPARWGHAAAFDARRGRTVLFGGMTAPGVYSGQTWEWDGTTWTLVSSAGPSARAFHAMAYDAVRQCVVLFGGFDGPVYQLADTWTWNGSAWTQVAATGPSARAFHAMAYDAERRRVVLYGGSGNLGLVGETWEWDGVAWAQPSAGPGPTPGPRNGHAMAYDAARRRIVLFGGSTPSASFNDDTWEWSGYAWTRLAVPAPSPRYGHAMVWDTAGAAVTLFGGRTGNGTYEADTWTWSGPTLPTAAGPADVTAAAGSLATLTVNVSGPGPVSYQWRKNGAALADGGPISGSQTATLTINPAMLGAHGHYDVVVATPCGSLLAGPAFLDVLCAADWDHNFVVNPADIAAFINDWIASLSQGTLVADFDGNGVVNPADIAVFINAWLAALGGAC